MNDPNLTPLSGSFSAAVSVSRFGLDAAALTPKGPSARMSPMPMRKDCRHYESRTYKSGEIVRKCALDLAPEAPWRCPDACAGFQQRRYDAGWQYGSLGKPAVSPDTEPEGDDIAALLDQAEDIVNAAAPDLLAEFAAREKKQRGLFRKGRKKKRR